MASTPRSMHPFDVPKEYYRIDGWRFTLKLVIAGTIFLSCAAVVMLRSPLLALPAQVVIGVVFAHCLELTHQALHLTAYRTKYLNRLVGVGLGMPMLVSFTHYQVTHRHHHAWIGTEQDREFFSYDREDLSSWGALLKRALSMIRYRGVLQRLWNAVRGRQFPEAQTPDEQHAIRWEYLLMVGLIVSAVGGSLLTGSWLVVKMWLVPLLFAEPVHYLIELPEHIHCDHDTHYMLHNTRTISGSWFSHWITNGNNYHVEHHYAPRVSIDRLSSLHEVLKPHHRHYCQTYMEFYREAVASSKKRRTTKQRAAA